ncbi:ParA family protein [Cellulomonas edaphi]|uniref:AAA family ATPase n=1 Tax=Cellulomonas edaphi TaxID=3053468 RepID=A0ABT7S3E9_9CELL|nr:AAA family ATPase [Cellulomons edaphi]MDM7830148.1 AAA family ATPase [Cellulomons edaphi]
MFGRKKKEQGDFQRAADAGISLGLAGASDGRVLSGEDGAAAHVSVPGDVDHAIADPTGAARSFSGTTTATATVSDIPARDAALDGERTHQMTNAPDAQGVGTDTPALPYGLAEDRAERPDGAVADVPRAAVASSASEGAFEHISPGIVPGPTIEPRIYTDGAAGGVKAPDVPGRTLTSAHSAALAAPLTHSSPHGGSVSARVTEPPAPAAELGGQTAELGGQTVEPGAADRTHGGEVAGDSAPAVPPGAGATEERTDPAGPRAAHDPVGGSTDHVSRETVTPADSLRSTDTPHPRSHPPVNEIDPDERRRAALVESLPAVSDETPLMAELRLDARRRIELRGRRFPAPPETRVITVANQKGGVGKTTTTVNMAAALAQSGLHVLVLDNDPQGNASTALGIDHRAGTPSIYEVLVESKPMAEAVQVSPHIPTLWCLPATIDLSGAEIELVSMVARETRLRTALDGYLEWRAENGLPRLDYVFVDCPPSLGLLTVNAFVVGREVMIPIQCEYYALEGLSQLLKTIELIQAHLNQGLHVSTILLTMYDARTNLAQQVAEEVRTHFPERTLRTSVPRSVRISEAPSYGQTVITYDPGSSGALAYLEAARELAERGAGAGRETTHATQDGQEAAR